MATRRLDDDLSEPPETVGRSTDRDRMFAARRRRRVVRSSASASRCADWMASSADGGEDGPEVVDRSVSLGASPNCSSLATAPAQP